MGAGAWTWTPNSNWVNEFRVGYTRFRQPYLSVDANVNPVAYGINTGITDPRFFGFPRLSISGFGFILGGNWPKIRGPNGSLQFLDHVSILRGNHAIKFGGEIVRNNATGFITSNGKSRFRFKSLTQFLQGTLSSSGGQTTVEAGDPTRNYSNGQYAAFLQDDWRFTRRLTLNLGLRYELVSVVKERNGLEGNFDPTLGLEQVGFQISSPYNGDHNNVSPRLGIAWDVFGTGKTVVRAGGSLMYETLPIATFSDIANSLGLSLEPTAATKIYCSTLPCVSGSSSLVTQAGIGTSGVTQVTIPGTSGLNAGWQAQTAACLFTTNCGPVIPANVIAVSCGDGLTFTPAGGARVIDPPPCNVEAADRNLRAPYITTWTVNLQQAFTNNFSLQAAYVGTHGTKLLGFQDINQAPLGTGASCPSLLPAGTTGNCQQASRPFFAKFPYLGEIARLANIDFSNYNGLQLTATERASHGLSFVGGYTWAHALAEASSNWNGLTVPPDSNNPRYLYGNSTFDIRQRFTFSVTYDIPGRKAPGQLLEGWSLNSIVALQTGQPWQPQDSANDFTLNGEAGVLATYGQTWNFSGSPKDFTSSPNPIPCWGGTAGNALTCATGAVGSATTTITAAPAACTSAANTAALLAQLNAIGCYYKGSSALIPAALGTVGNAGQGIFRDSGFHNWDLSVTKIWKFRERLTTQFRAEFFNVLNRPEFANPGGPAAPGWNDPSASTTFGCGCGTPDQVAPNPVLGTGGNRSIQLGLKLLW
jgi:TonB-dependent receptor-like protein